MFTIVISYYLYCISEEKHFLPKNPLRISAYPSYTHTDTVIFLGNGYAINRIFWNTGSRTSKVPKRLLKPLCFVLMFWTPNANMLSIQSHTSSLVRKTFASLRATLPNHLSATLCLPISVNALDMTSISIGDVQADAKFNVQVA